MTVIRTRMRVIMVTIVGFMLRMGRSPHSKEMAMLSLGMMGMHNLEIY